MAPRQDPSSKPSKSATIRAPAPREAQRRRTRAAIVDATQRLLRDGIAAPSVDEIATAADVSRRTVYAYFPTVDQLLLDAAVGSLSSDSIEATFAATTATDVPGRIEELVRALLVESARTLPLGRQIIRLTIDQDQPAVGVPRRGYRRVQWIERAVEPLRPDLSTEQFGRLVSALAVITGWEAMTVLRDVRALSPDEEQSVSNWAARALVQAIMAEERAAPHTAEASPSTDGFK